MTTSTDRSAAEQAASTEQPIRAWRLSEVGGPKWTAAKVAELEAERAERIAELKRAIRRRDTAARKAHASPRPAWSWRTASRRCGWRPGDDAPFAEAVDLYIAAGWIGVLPVGNGPRQKAEPPKGLTGHQGRWPNASGAREWKVSRGDRNIALRLESGIVGIDVDAYGDKPGAVTLGAARGRPWSAASDVDLVGTPGAVGHPALPRS